MTKSLYIPFHKFRYLGGPSSFMMNLKDYLDKAEYKYSRFFFGAKGIFFPMGYRPAKLWIAKRLGMKVIQRLDGVYYPSQHGENYYKFNELQLKTYNNYSDFIVFQSEYSKKQVFEMFGEIPQNKYEIIHNGVDKNYFYPSANKLKKSNNIKFIVAGAFRKKAMIEPIVLALDKLKNKFDFELLAVGPINLKEIEIYFKRDYVNWVGAKSKNEIADLYRESDILLHTQINDNCPNIVLEAISTGLPVVGFDSGSMSELCHFSKDLLAYVSDEVFQKYEDFDYNKLAEKIELAVDNYGKYREIALNNANLYDFEECGKRYIDVFDKVLEIQDGFG